MGYQLTLVFASLCAHSCVFAPRDREYFRTSNLDAGLHLRHRHLLCRVLWHAGFALAAWCFAF